jgi:chorismate mutase
MTDQPMEAATRYLLVDARVVPEVFLLVVRAKELLARGKAKNLSEATKLVGISRSTFYKYKDSVHHYETDKERRIATIYAELEDTAGVLSNLLTQLSDSGANILTINQSIPVDGVAPVSISMRTDGLRRELEPLLDTLGELDGLVSIRLLQ